MPVQVVAKSAEEDLREILSYIADDNIEAALRMFQRFRECFTMLSTMPQSGRRRSDLEPDLRSFPEGTYVIFYREITDGVEILRVLHGSRDIESLFENMGGLSKLT